MSVERIPINTQSNLYFIEAAASGTGISFSQVYEDGRKKIIATIIDNGTEFILSKISEYGIHIKSFNTDLQTRLIDGTLPPFEIDEQVEVLTKHNRKMIVRNLYDNNESTGVIIIYSDGSTLWSLAICRVYFDSILISLPE